MFFTLDVRRARKGDCLILHYGSKKEPGLALIDGGPSNVYKPHLKPRLAEIRKARGLADNASLPVDFLMVSHIDDDHIKGVLELTKELIDAQGPIPLKIKGVWHNTFDDIIGNNPDKLTAAVTAQFGTASLSGDGEEVEGLDPDAARVLASVSQGFRLRDDTRALKLRINPEFKGKLVLAKKKGKQIDMGKGLKFTVIGPMNDEVLALQQAHDEFLQKQQDKAEASLAAFADKSVPNLSSLVVLAEVGKKRILLTGDARGDKILEGLELVGLLNDDGESKIHIDILKCPHHGSIRNVEDVFFRRITADHYVFSGNGEHGNPDRETLELLLAERGDEDYTVHLTYPIDEIDVERKNECKKKGKPWSPKKQSLAAFLDANKKFAKKIQIVDEKKPHLINLLDEM